jgi:uncharacterized membrane protein YeaQ/YmgE (transglycosylase-associated protein family)
MAFLLAILVGLVAGIVITYLARAPDCLFLNSFVGISGAAAGNWIYENLHRSMHHVVASVAFACLAAAILLGSLHGLLWLTQRKAETGAVHS